MTKLNFKAKQVEINSWKIIKLPKDISEKLPSRGMLFIKGKIPGFEFQAPLEPDGKKGHWFKLEKNISKEKELDIEIEPLKEWPKPKIPEDFAKALKENPKQKELFESVTPRAQWDWIRWIRSTKNPETRKKRIQVSISKLKKGMKRPCCFNQSSCTVPEVSNSGILIEN